MTEDRNTEDFTKDQASFLQLEAGSVWDRHKQLQDKNKTITETVLKLYSVLLVFAAFPFSREGILETGFSRVWGFGGAWLALAAWIYCDRAFRAYGSHLFEQVFCMRQIAQLREVMMGSSMRYAELSLLATSKNERIDHVSSSQMLYTAYFYKLLSLFTPMYLCLFLAMIMFPHAMFDPKIHTTRAIYLRTMLGFSGVFFFWLGSSMKRCYRLQKQAFRARRISSEKPLPKFPEEENLSPGPVDKNQKGWEKLRLLLRNMWWKVRTWAKRLCWGLAYLFAVANVVRFLQLYVAKPDALDNAYWWQHTDLILVSGTFVLFAALFILLEADLRIVLKIASDKNPVRQTTSP